MITTAIKQKQKTSEFHSVWLTLKLTFGLVPIVAGADKFTNLLTDWQKYLNEDILRLLPFDAGTFMIVVGIIEIAAGIIVLMMSEIGAFVVAAWLVCIAITLIMSMSYLDVAVRDLVMAVGALTLARLTKIKIEATGNGV